MALPQTTTAGEKGRFGPFGGRYVPETLMPALEELERAYEAARADASFQRELAHYLAHYVGRPTPLYLARRLSEHAGGARIYLKREDLTHTGAHKINNTMGQILLARRMGKRRIIAETGAGQHGVATATVCAMFGMECVVYMGEEDTRRQALNVFRMELLGARVVPVTSGTRTLKDAPHEARRLRRGRRPPARPGAAGSRLPQASGASLLESPHGDGPHGQPCERDDGRREQGAADGAPRSRRGRDQRPALLSPYARGCRGVHRSWTVLHRRGGASTAPAAGHRRHGTGARRAAAHGTRDGGPTAPPGRRSAARSQGRAGSPPPAAA